jgi:hypothetical protein
MSGTDSHCPQETRWVLLLIALIAAVHLLTLTRMPCVWADEAVYCDPAVNWVRGHGFVSTAWWGQRDDQFWAANAPLYQFLLCGWLKVAGVSIVTVRLASVILCLASGFVMWLFVRKSGLVSGMGWQLALLVCYLCSLHVVFASRSGRPDMLGILLVWLAALAYVTEDHTRRRWTLGLIGMFIPAAGLQVCSYSVVAAMFLTLFLGRRFIGRIMPLFAGQVVGGLAMLALFACNGVLWPFIVRMVGVDTSIGRKLMANDPYVAQCIATGVGKEGPSVDWLYGGLWKDPGIVAMGMVMAVTVLASRFRLVALPAEARRLAWIGVLALALIPLGIMTHAHYSANYAWMGCTPAIVAFFGMASRLDSASRWFRLVLKLMVLGITVAGLPFISAVALAEWSQRDYARVERFVAAYAAPDDTVWLSAPAYYAALDRFKRFYFSSYPLTERERQSFRLAFGEPGIEKYLAERLGGAWVQEGQPLDLRDQAVIRLPMTFFTQYRLAAYRRIEDGAVGSVRR